MNGIAQTLGALRDFYGWLEQLGGRQLSDTEPTDARSPGEAQVFNDEDQSGRHSDRFERAFYIYGLPPL